MLDSTTNRLMYVGFVLLVLVLPSYIQAKPVSPCELSTTWDSSNSAVFSESSRLSNSSTHPSTPSFLSKTLHLKCIALSSFQEMSFELVSSIPNGIYAFNSPRSFAPVFKTHEYSSSVQVRLPMEDHHLESSHNPHQDYAYKMTLLIHTLTHNGVSLTQAVTLSPLKQPTSPTASPSSIYSSHIPPLHKNIKISRQPTPHMIRFSRGKMNKQTPGKP